MKNIRVLVTGAGSGVGQGIIKALRVSNLSVTIISSDIGPHNCALYRTDEALLLPKVEDPGSLGTIIAKLKENGIQVLMIGSEFDLLFFARHKDEIEKESGAMVVVSPLPTVEIADDKWSTTQFLKEHGLPHAEAYLPKNMEDAVRRAEDWGYPLVMKTRNGTSNRHVHILKDRDALKHLFAGVPNPMLQRLVDMPRQQLENEYTCSIFKCSDGRVLGPFTARRTLRAGSSWVVEVAEFKELHPLLLDIAKNIETMGSLNVQLMLGKNGPIPFEFNARFSGTTAVRAHFGFNEPEMAIRDFFLHEKVEPPRVRGGLAFRYLEEVFLDDVRAGDIQEPFKKGVVRRWF